MTLRGKSDVTGTLTAFAAEGARVGLYTCQKCGAAVLVDPRLEFDAVERHREWHRELENAWRLSR